MNKEIFVDLVIILFAIGFSIWIGTLIVIPKGELYEGGGLRINSSYLKSVSGREAFVNDVYVTAMVNFADECEGNQSFFRHSDLKGRLQGVTLWCRHNQQAFTFFYSDKWRSDVYEKK